jgi:toxin ParE1/3/4
VAEIVWTEEAQRWLAKIFDYIAEHDPAAAARTVEGIYERAQDLARFPLLGARYTHSSRHVRLLLYGHYRIAYLVVDDGNIAVLGVFHDALDITRYPL